MEEEIKRKVEERFKAALENAVDKRVEDQVNIKMEPLKKQVEDMAAKIKSFTDKQVSKDDDKKKFQCTICEWRGINPSVVKAHMTKKHK